MKVIDAYWEKKNLGMSAVEVILNNDDLNIDYLHFADKMHTIKKKYAYVVIKITAGSYKLINFVNDLGFKFIESQIKYSINLKRIKLSNNRGIHVNDSFSLKLVSDRKSYNYVISEIKKGVFNTDRIAIDNRFGVDVSNIRYANWLDDMFGKDESKLFILYYKGQPFGFHAGSCLNSLYQGNFGGVFVDYQKGMFGAYWSYLFIDGVKDIYEKVMFSCSSNNLKVIKLWHIFEPTIENIQYVFTN